MKIVLASLFSARYPAIGETHALSVLAGALLPTLASGDELHIYDMVLEGRERYDHLFDLFATVRPDVICLSVGYGTFSKIRPILDGIARINLATVRIYGGALPHYLYDKLLSDIDPGAFVVRGEGDEILPTLVNRLRERKSIEDLPNLAFARSGVIQQTGRKTADLSSLPLPHRGHLAQNPDRAFQVFSELSRGCSWAGCTFCLRGLLDNEGKRTEYRRFPRSRVVEDLNVLTELGFTSVTFADEDFFGGSISDLEYAVGALEEYSRGAVNRSPLKFDVSVTPHSIYSASVGDEEQLRRNDLLRRARSAGVRKVFLGIESGSAPQLKRYAKGHSKDDALRALKSCEEIGFELEIGWILFDPLVTLEEVEESLEFLVLNDLSRYASYVFNEVRVQKDSRYLKLVNAHQLKTGTVLLSNACDEDTLTYAHTYVDARITRLISYIQSLEAQFRRVHYPLKNLVRFGVSGAAGIYAPEARNLLSKIRTNMVINCLSLVRSIYDEHLDVSSSLDLELEIRWREQVAEFHNEASRIASAILEAEHNPLAERIRRPIG